IFVAPDGLTDSYGQQYWNATDFCCSIYASSPPDDVAYLTAILDDVRLKYRIDPKRVFAMGHSNGGFMSNRLACDRADRFAAIVSFAGAQWKDISHCKPTEPVAMLQVHGTLDTLVNYAGTPQYPGAVETTSDWATLDGCTTTRSSAGPNLDLL